MGNVSPLQALGCVDWARYVCNSLHCKSQCCDQYVTCSIDTDAISVASSSSSDAPSLWNLWGAIK